MTRVVVNVMGIKVKEYETKKEVTISSILDGVKKFKQEMDKLGVPCKINSKMEKQGDESK